MMRIVSLLPSATEIVYSLGLGDRLVGVSSDCDHPLEARREAGGLLVVAGPRRERTPGRDRRSCPLQCGRLGADLPAGSGADPRAPADPHPRAGPLPGMRRSLGTRHRGARDSGLRRGCHLVGSDRPRGCAGRDRRGRARRRGERQRRRWIAHARIDAVRDKTKDLAPIPLLALEWADPPFTGGHWIPEMVRLAGGADILGAERAPSRSCTWDEVAASRPEKIVFMPCGYRLADAIVQAGALREVPGFASAARHAQVWAVDGSSYFSRPGPRLVDGLEILAWIVHPESFAQPPPGRVARVPM